MERKRADLPKGLDLHFLEEHEKWFRLFSKNKVGQDIYKNEAIRRGIDEAEIEVKRTLDIGGGGGELTRLIGEKYPEIERIYLDPSEHAHSVAFWNGIREGVKNLKILKRRMQDTGLEDSSVEAAFMIMPPIDWEKPEKNKEGINTTLKEAVRVLKEGGKLVLVNHEPEGLMFEGKTPNKINEDKKKELIELYPCLRESLGKGEIEMEIEMKHDPELGKTMHFIEDYPDPKKVWRLVMTIKKKA